MQQDYQMTHRTADEAKCRCIEKMGEPLGTQYAALWQEVAWLHMKWAEFGELYSTKASRVDLLNKTAPTFFRIVQDIFFEDLLLHICRLTDPPTSVGQIDRENLTICALPGLIEDSATKEAVTALVQIARQNTAFARDWRNRHIAHRDLDLALQRTPATPLATATRTHVSNALNSIANVMNAAEAHYLDSETHFPAASTMQGASSLLHVLDDGLRAQSAREERLRRGQIAKQDYPRKL